jgi:hypothetical protein
MLAISTAIFLTGSIIIGYKNQNLINRKNTIKKSATEKKVVNKKAKLKKAATYTDEFLPINTQKDKRIKSPLQIDFRQTLATSELKFIPYNTLVEITIPKRIKTLA